MADITARYEQRPSILASLRGLVEAGRAYFQRQRTFDRIYGELSSLSDRELADIGISRSQIVDVAWSATGRD